MFRTDLASSQRHLCELRRVVSCELGRGKIRLVPGDNSFCPCKQPRFRKIHILEIRVGTVVECPIQNRSPHRCEVHKGAEILDQRTRIGVVYVFPEIPEGTERKWGQYATESVLLNQIHEADRLSVVRPLLNRRINQNIGVEKDPHAVMTEAVVTYRSCMLSTSRLNYGPTISLLRGSVIGSLRNRTQGSRNPTRDGSQLLGRRRSVSRCSPSALTLRACMLGQDPEVGFD